MNFLVFLNIPDCGPSAVLKTILFVRTLMEVLEWGVPILLIVMITVDVTKAVISPNEENMEKCFALALKRLVYAVMFILVPTIINASINLLDSVGVDGISCYNDVNNTVIASAEAMEAKERAIEEEKMKETESKDIGKNNSLTIVGDSNGGNNNNNSGSKVSGCDGLVYYDGTTFYKFQKETGKQYNGTAKSKGTGSYGYNKYFFEMLTKFQEAATKAGKSFTYSQNEGDGAWRTIEKQQEYWNCYQTQSCNGGVRAAQPGCSDHGWGIGADLKYMADPDWLKANAGSYGLTFAVGDENWHITPMNLEMNDEMASKCL